MRAANKFFLSCTINFGRRADQSLEAARRLAEQRLGDPVNLWATIAALPIERWAQIYARLRSVIGMQSRHTRIRRIGAVLASEYAGDARRLWQSATPPEVMRRLEQLQLGPKLSRMTVGALLDTGHLVGTGDVAPDTHVRRVLGRLVLGQKATAQEAVELARLVHPANPWLLDAPAFFHGIETCRAKPHCLTCALQAVCALFAAGAEPAAPAAQGDSAEMPAVRPR